MFSSVDKRILITGGTGFAGSHLIEALLQEGYQDVHTTSYSEPPEHLRELLPPENFHKIDLTDSEVTNELFSRLKPDQVYHLASFAFVGESFAKAPQVFQNNLTLQINVLEAVKTHVPQARVMITGSAEEYGVSIDESEIPIDEDHPLRPVNPYAVSKVAQDLLAYSYGLSFDLDIVRVRPFNHIGEGQTTDFVVPAFVSQIVEIERGYRKELKVGNLDSVRDFTDVKDMVRAYIVVMEKGQINEVYNIGSGQGTKLEDLVELIKKLATVKVAVISEAGRRRPHDVPVMIADNTKISQLGWKPEIPLEQTLERIFHWHRQQKKATL